MTETKKNKAPEAPEAPETDKKDEVTPEATLPMEKAPEAPEAPEPPQADPPQAKKPSLKDLITKKLTKKGSVTLMSLGGKTIHKNQSVTMTKSEWKLLPAYIKSLFIDPPKPSTEDEES